MPRHDDMAAEQLIAIVAFGDRGAFLACEQRSSRGTAAIVETGMIAGQSSALTRSPIAGVLAIDRCI